MTPFTSRAALLCAIALGLFGVHCGSDDNSGSGSNQTGGASGDGGNTGGTAGTSGSAGDAAGGASGEAGAAGQGTGGASGAAGSAWYAGVNLAGAEFGNTTLPGEYGKEYTYPTKAEADYFKAKGMTIIRLPFLWERLQPSQYAELDSQELARLDSVVTYATGIGLHVILDPHNYARYYGEVIGGGKVTVEDFAAFWSRVSAHYKDNPLVLFGLMNEPHTMPTEHWLMAANAAIAAIRNAGASQLVLVPGNGWTGGHSWLQDWYGNANGTVMAYLTDPGDNYAFEIHQYLDAGYAGITGECESVTVGSQALTDVTQWMREHGRKAFLGEFGAANTLTCENAVHDELSWLKANQDVWLGFTWWAAGPWWGEYMYSLEPQGLPDSPQDKPQLAWLTPFL